MSKQVDELLLNLVHEVSSIRAGKTFTPTDYTKPVSEAIEALIQQKQLEAVAEAKAELRAKFGIDADKQYDVKIGNGVIVAQLQPTKEIEDE